MPIQLRVPSVIMGVIIFNFNFIWRLLVVILENQNWKESCFTIRIICTNVRIWTLRSCSTRVTNGKKAQLIKNRNSTSSWASRRVREPSFSSWQIGARKSQSIIGPSQKERLPIFRHTCTAAPVIIVICTWQQQGLVGGLLMGQQAVATEQKQKTQKSKHTNNNSYSLSSHNES